MDCPTIKKNPQYMIELSEDPTNALSDELILEIFKYLSPKDLGCCTYVNKRWCRIARDSTFPQPLESLSTNPSKYLKLIKSYNPIISPWERIDIDSPIKISTFNRQSAQLITENNFLRLKHLWKRKPMSILIQSIVAEVGPWKIKKGLFDQHLFEICGHKGSKFINISYPHPDPSWRTIKPSFFAIQENLFGLSSEYGNVQIWDCKSGRCLRCWDFENTFKALGIEIKSAHYFCNRLILDGTSSFKKSVQLVFCLINELLIPNNIYIKLEKFGFKFSQGVVLKNQIICFRVGLVASFCFREGGMIQLDWSCEVPGEYRMEAVNDRWIVLKKNKKIKIYQTKTGDFCGSLSVSAKITYLKLQDHIFCYAKKTSPHIFFCRLPTLKGCRIKLPYDKILKRSYEIRDVALNDSQMVVLQVNRRHFRLITRVVYKFDAMDKEF